ncbi:hypothetical protein Thi970DRAFT_01813 [Thiorhodovibrio frisius]|uniref:Uncharacterized protein n=1 Tax=Thiorhodovibrio frisius TaxID=631362 RepID=H8Z2E2_9GAMM|nr:hypothetical protein Thi970DRAFT_01813 [Thiorhodovibrio frisius]WPL21564.1 hypothetical protein Thiofri_01690 [Thiorhodovibrio frisius]
MLRCWDAVLIEPSALAANLLPIFYLAKTLPTRAELLDGRGTSEGGDLRRTDLLICHRSAATTTATLRKSRRISHPRRGGEILVAHLMSRDELREHHGRHHAVARDLLPAETEMRGLFERAGMPSLAISDRPGLYLARGVAGSGLPASRSPR